MTIKPKLRIISMLLVFTFGYLPASVDALGSPKYHFDNPEIMEDLHENGRENVVGFLYLNDFLVLKIGKQPARNSNFVTLLPDFVTEYHTALNYGTIGLLAHNYLAGQYFFKILPGQEIELVFGNYRKESFVVTQIEKFQAVSPNSSSSDFIDLATGDYLTVSQLFRKMYANQTGHLVLQTCIYADQNLTWGRLFIIAEPNLRTTNNDNPRDKIYFNLR
jgi:hypothetical protein